MKKIILSFAGITAFTMIGMLFFNHGSLYSNGSGAPTAGACTSCHGGTVNTTDPNLILEVIDDIGNEATAYIPGKSYIVYMEYSKPGISKMGYALSANGGVLAKVDPSDVTSQIKNGFATHTSTGTAAVDDTAFWAVEWTAPASGPVTMQLYVNATNSNGSDNGDLIYGKSVTLLATTGIKEASAIKGYTLFPNPTSDLLNIGFDIAQESNISIQLMSLDGKSTVELFEGKHDKGMFNQQFDVAHIAKGVYLLEVHVGENKKVSKLLLN